MSDRISLNAFAKFCVAPSKEQVDLVKEMIGATWRKSGPGYWQPVVTAYRKWIAGEYASRSDCLRAFRYSDQRLEKLKKLLAGDRLAGSEVLKSTKCSLHIAGFHINTTPELLVRNPGALLAIRFHFSCEALPAGEIGPIVADTMREGFVGTSIERAIPMLVDAEGGTFHRASGNRQLAVAKIRGRAVLLREIWNVLVNESAA